MEEKTSVGHSSRTSSSKGNSRTSSKQKLDKEGIKKLSNLGKRL